MSTRTEETMLESDDDVPLHGYVCISPDVKLGKDVKLAKFINLYGCEIGDETKIGTFVEIQKNAKVGRRCKISSHTFICEGVTIEDDVFIGHGVTFINDTYPRATTADGRAADRGGLEGGADAGQDEARRSAPARRSWSNVDRSARTPSSAPAAWSPATCRPTRSWRAIRRECLRSPRTGPSTNRGVLK